MKRLSIRVVLLLSFIVVGLLTLNANSARAAESLNMQLVGTNDLQARSTYQPIVQRQGNRVDPLCRPSRVGDKPGNGSPVAVVQSNHWGKRTERGVDR